VALAEFEVDDAEPFMTGCDQRRDLDIGEQKCHHPRRSSRPSADTHAAWHKQRASTSNIGLGIRLDLRHGPRGIPAHLPRIDCTPPDTRHWLRSHEIRDVGNSRNAGK
jgi:hypothetical protein